MAREDGSVLIKANVDVSAAEKNLAKLKSSIAETESDIEEMTQKKAEAEKASVFSAAELDAEKAKLEQIRDVLRQIKIAAKDTTVSEATRSRAELEMPIAQKDMEEQAEKVKKIRRELNSARKDVDRYNQKLEEANRKLSQQTEEAGQLAKEINSVSKASRKMAEAQKKAEKSMARFGMRLSAVIRSALVFTVITQSLAKLRDWMGKLVKTNADATAAIAKLKGALLTLAQPLVDVIIPAFISLVNILTKVVTVAAQLVNYLFGKSAKQSAESAEALNDQMNALEGVGEAAEDSSKSLASFDEINRLSSEGGAEAAEPIKPDFELDLDMSESQLQNLLSLVTSIGVAFAAWKLSSALGGGLTNMVGALMAIGGAVLFAQGLFDAWANGVSWQNIQQSILGITAAAAGLYLLLGPTAAGIALIVGGIAMLVTGFKDAMDVGFNLQNTMMSIAGIIATGLGISVLTGSLLPALIAGIAAVLLAVTVATGHGEQLLDGVKQMLSGFVEFFKGIFTGDIQRAIAGLSDIFDGFGNIVDSALQGIRDLFLGFFDWLDEKTGGKLHGTLTFFKELFANTFDTVRNIVSSVIQSVKKILSGVITFLSGVFTGNWEKAWEGIKEIFSGIWNAIVGIFTSAIEGIVSAAKSLWEAITGLFSSVKKNNPNFTGYGPDYSWMFQSAASTISIPALATGAVIPPNREFLAVLGDQTYGNNIEAPESLIRKIVREETQNNSRGDVNLVLTGELAALARVLRPYIQEEDRRVGVNLVTK